MSPKDDTQNSQNSNQEKKSEFENIIDRLRKHKKKDDDSLPPIGTIYGLLSDNLLDGLLIDAYLDKWQKKKAKEKRERGETE